MHPRPPLGSVLALCKNTYTTVSFFEKLILVYDMGFLFLYWTQLNFDVQERRYFIIDYSINKLEENILVLIIH